ncbi:MAG: hypothetical protein R2715_22910 [Ilumatobacteraceae bacterium]
MLTSFDHHDLGVLVEAAKPSSRRRAARHTTHDHVALDAIRVVPSFVLHR